MPEVTLTVWTSPESREIWLSPVTSIEWMLTSCQGRIVTTNQLSAVNNLNDVGRTHMCKLAKLSVCRILALVRLTGSTEVGSELHNDEAVNDRIYNPYKRYFLVASEFY